MGFVKVHHGGGKHTWWNVGMASNIKQIDDGKSVLTIGTAPLTLECSPQEIIAAVNSGAVLNVPGAKEPKATEAKPTAIPARK